MPILARASAALAALDLELVQLTHDGTELGREHLGLGVSLGRRGEVLVRGAPLLLAPNVRHLLRVVGSVRVVLEL